MISLFEYLANNDPNRQSLTPFNPVFQKSGSYNSFLVFSISEFLVKLPEIFQETKHELQSNLSDEN
jgi:hypothetical protein